jgi:hypothetical protein
MPFSAPSHLKNAEGSFVKVRVLARQPFGTLRLASADRGDDNRGDEGSGVVEIGIAFGQEMDPGQLAWFTLCV